MGRLALTLKLVSSTTASASLNLGIVDIDACFNRPERDKKKCELIIDCCGVETFTKDSSPRHGAKSA